MLATALLRVEEAQPQMPSCKTSKEPLKSIKAAEGVLLAAVEEECVRLCP